MAVASLAVLAFESFPGVRFAQETPWTTTAGLALLPIVLLAGAWRPGTRLSRLVWLFAAYAVVHSFVAVGIEALGGGATGPRLVAWLRQLLALGAGIALFTTMRAALPLVGTARAVRAVSLASLPGLALASLNVTAALLYWGAPFRLERAIREVMVPLGSRQWMRAQGFSSEPSHFAFLLGAMTIPATIVLVRVSRGRARVGWLAMLCAQLGALVFTFSGTGFLVLGAGLLTALVTRWRRLALWSGAAALAGVLLLIAVRPINYITLRVEVFTMSMVGQGGRLDETIINLMSGSIGPLLRMDSSLVLLGYGLGGSATHIDEMVPRQWIPEIRMVSWKGMPNLRSLTGRILAETGAVGLALFIAVIVSAWRRFGARGGLARGTRLERELATAGRVAIAAMLTGFVLKYGSFTTPYLWLWLALADWPAPGDQGADAAAFTSP